MWDSLVVARVCCQHDITVLEDKLVHALTLLERYRSQYGPLRD
jgi:hypothetical protein